MATKCPIESSNTMDSVNESSPGPVLLEMELPPASDIDKGEDESEKANKKILKKVKTIECQLNILFYAVLISPFVVIGVLNHSHGHIPISTGWIWLIVALFYLPVLFYGLWRLCKGFCVTKPLSPAELAYLQENED